MEARQCDEDKLEYAEEHARGLEEREEVKSGEGRGEENGYIDEREGARKPRPPWSDFVAPAKGAKEHQDPVLSEPVAHPPQGQEAEPLGDDDGEERDYGQGGKRRGYQSKVKGVGRGRELGPAPLLHMNPQQKSIEEHVY